MINHKKAANHHQSGLKLLSASSSIITNLTFLDWFLILFLMDYVKGKILPGMNQRLHKGNPHVSEHDFIKWLGVWLVIGSTKETGV